MPPTIEMRNTGQLDDFERANENPVQPPWYIVPGNFNMKIDAGTLDGTEFPPVPALAYYAGREFYGQTVETWGIMAGDAAETDGWRFGMYTVDSLLHTGLPNGYQCLPHNSIGAWTWTLRRYDNGNPTAIDSGPEGTMGNTDIVLMRRVGTNIEVWHWRPSTDVWVLRHDVADTTYTIGPFYFIYGATGVETGWQGIGGGVKNRQHIYRWLRAPART